MPNREWKWIWLGPTDGTGAIQLPLEDAKVYAALAYQAQADTLRCSLHLVFKSPDGATGVAIQVLCDERKQAPDWIPQGWFTARVRGGAVEVDANNVASAPGNSFSTPLNNSLELACASSGLLRLKEGSWLKESSQLKGLLQFAGSLGEQLPAIGFALIDGVLSFNHGADSLSHAATGDLEPGKQGFGKFNDPADGDNPHLGFQLVLAETEKTVSLGPSGARAAITPTALRLRLHVAKNDLRTLFCDLWAPAQHLVADPLGTVTFSLPLIKAREPNSTAPAKRIVVGSGLDNDPLLALSWKVKIACPAEPDKKPLFRVKVPLPADDTLDPVPSELTAVTDDTLQKLSRLAAAAVTDSRPSFGGGKLSDLFGDLGGLADPDEVLSFDLLTNQDSVITALWNAYKDINGLPLADFPVPIPLRANVGQSTWTFVVLARFDVWRGRLASNKMAMLLLDEVTQAPRILNLGAVAIIAPPAITIETLTADWKALLGKLASVNANGRELAYETLHRDGVFDIAQGEIRLDFHAPGGSPPTGRSLQMAFPGAIESPSDLSALKKALEKRVVLRSKVIDPDFWPSAGDQPTHLRLGKRGVSLAAEVDLAHPIDLADGQAPIHLTLEEKRGDVCSELVIINNQVRRGAFVGHLETPGFKDLRLDIVLGLRAKDAIDSDPTSIAVFAELDLSRAKKAPVASLRTEYLSAQIDDLRAKLDWDSGKWKLAASATGALSFQGIDDFGGLSGLDKPRAFPFRNLDLLKLHMPNGFTLPLRRAKRSREEEKQGATDKDDDQKDRSSPTADPPGRWEMLDGLFAVEGIDIDLEVEYKTRIDGVTRVPDTDGPLRIPKLESARFVITKPRFEFDAGEDSCDIAIDTDVVEIGWGGGTGKLSLKSRGPIGFQVRIGDSMSFEGRGEWKESPEENSFGAQGVLRCPGFPDIGATFKVGNGRKRDGRRVPAVVIYADWDRELDLFSGATLKRIGAGLAVNYRLAGVDRDPEPREILANLDQIRPESLSNWRFDTDDRTSIALVGSAWITASRGGPDLISPYALALTLIIDTDLNVVAAGETWLFTSMAKARLPANRSRPAIAGVLVIRPRKKTISFVAETRRNPFIEGNDRLATILSKASARLSFFASEELVDYYLEELRYDDTILGAEVHVFAGYRVAAGRFGVFLRAWFQVTGHLPRREFEVPDVGGFAFEGDLAYSIDFGGIASGGGMAAYGSLRETLHVQVSAYVIIATPFVEMRRMERTIPFSVTYPVVRCKRWGCRTRMETRTWEERIVVDVPVPVVKPVRYDSGSQSLDILLAGTLAFDEGGRIGFRGTVAVSVMICGFRLSIAPAWELHGDVIDNVRRRVAAVERQIDEIRALPPRENLTAAALNDAPDDVAPIAPEAGVTPAAPEAWTLYQRKLGNQTWCLLAPSPTAGNAGWYTPSADPRFYASMPRDPSKKRGDVAAGNVDLAASEVEKLQVTPFRDSVVRIVVPIKKTNADNTQARILDLVMPWDRGNMDALPEPSGQGEDTTSANPVRLQALRKLAQIEAELLATAFDDAERALDGFKEELNRWHFDPSRIVVARDPRIGSSDRRFWRPEDQVSRPDWAPPSDFRPASDLVALGIGPLPGAASGDPSVAEVIRYERLRERATQILAHDAAGLTIVGRRMQSRAALLASILADFERPQGPGPDSHYACVGYDRFDKPASQPGIVVERIGTVTGAGGRCDQKTPLAERCVTRRGLPILCEAEPDGNTVTFTLTDDIILNATDLFPDHSGEAAVEVTILSDAGVVASLTPTTHTFKGGDGTTTFTLTLANAIDGLPVIVPLTLTRPDNFTARLFLEVHAPDALENVDRRVGLVFTLSDGEEIDNDKVTIIRNAMACTPTIEDSAEANDLNTHPSTWFAPRRATITNAASVDNHESFSRSIIPLVPCQEFIDEAAGAGKSRVRVRLPVHFTDEFFTVHFASIHRFEILRQFAWESGPVSLAAVPLQVQTWQEDDGTQVVLPEPFLFTDEFPVIRTDEGPLGFDDPRLRPGVPMVRYFLRPIPFGESAASSARAPLLGWGKPVSLHIPPHRDPLPPLAIVFKPTFDGNTLKPDGVPDIALYEATGRRFNPASRPLELWVERLPIPLSGFYAPGDEIGDGAPTTATTVRSPADLLPRSLPESTVGKILVGRYERDNDEKDEKDRFTPAKGLADAEALAKKLTGYRTRWFVRDEGDSSPDRRLVPLAMFLVRDRLFPASIATGAAEPQESPAGLQPIDSLELIPQSEIRRIREPEWHSSGSVSWEIRSLIPCRADLPEAEKKRLPKGLAIDWLTPATGLDGGVEILVEDRFRPGRIDRITAEVFSEDLFPRTETDFRHADSWRLHRGHASGANWTDTSAVAGDAAEIWKSFVWQAPNNPLCSVLERTQGEVTTELANIVKEPPPALDWRPLHQAFTNRATAVAAYLRSPLVIEGASIGSSVLDRKQEEALRDLFLARARLLFLAMPSPAAPAAAPAATAALEISDAQKKFDAIKEVLQAIDAADPRKETYRDGITNAEDFKQRLLDHELASRLAAVIRTRLRIADAILAPPPEGTLGLPEARHAEGWPCKGEWNECVRRWVADHKANSDGETKGKTPRPLTERVLALGWWQSEIAPASLDTAALLKGALPPDAINPPLSPLTNLEKLVLKPAESSAIGNEIATQVVEAAGLTAALDALKRDMHPRGWRLVRRAHHQQTRDSAPIPLATLLPPAAADGPLPTAAEGAIHALHVLEWMGFSLDIALVDDLNRPFSQRELLDQLRAYDWKALLSTVPGDHRVYFIVGREPDTTLPPSPSASDVAPGPLADDDDALGYGFVTLAVVPETFVSALRALWIAEPAQVQEVETGWTITLTVTLPKDSSIRLSRLDERERPTGDAWYGKPTINDHTLTIVKAQAPWLTKTAKVFVSVAKDPNDSSFDTVGKWLTPRRLALPKADGKSIDPRIVLSELVLGLDAAALPLDVSPADNADKGPKLLVVERWARRWQQVPAVGGWSRVSWDAPDRLGRTVCLAIRRLSRYDRHLRWLEGTDPSPTPMPSEGIHEIPLRRTLVANEEPLALDVRTIPHPTRVQFAYTLPSSASQSLLSAEAARRTGFAEIEVDFAAEPRTRRSGIEGWSKIDSPPTIDLAADLTTVPIKPASDNPEADLHRMERLVALPTLPYHLTYSMAARPRYAGDGDVGESKPNYAKASRRPSQVAVWIPTVQITKDTEATVTLILSRYVDLMNVLEKKEAERLDALYEKAWPTVSGDTQVAFRHLPDDEVTYSISTVDSTSHGNQIETTIARISKPASESPEIASVSETKATVDPHLSHWEHGNERLFARTITIPFASAPADLRAQLQNPANYRLTATRDGVSRTTSMVKAPPPPAPPPAPPAPPAPA